MHPFAVNMFGVFTVIALTIAWVCYFLALARRELKTPFIAVALLLAITSGLFGANLAFRRHQRKTWRQRLTQLSAAAAGAQPLIASIRAFEARKGVPPSSLVPIPPAPPPSTDVAKAPTWLYGEPGMIIGPPTVPKTRWAVGVKVKSNFCPRCGMSFGDTFVYHSDGIYPKHLYGGVLERVGAWAYYHE